MKNKNRKTGKTGDDPSDYLHDTICKAALLVLVMNGRPKPQLKDGHRKILIQITEPDCTVVKHVVDC